MLVRRGAEAAEKDIDIDRRRESWLECRVPLKITRSDSSGSRAREGEKRTMTVLTAVAALATVLALAALAALVALGETLEFGTCPADRVQVLSTSDVAGRA